MAVSAAVFVAAVFVAIVAAGSESRRPSATATVAATDPPKKVSARRRQQQPCVYTLAMLSRGLEPPAGSCAGPSARAAARRAALEGGGCGLGRVSFVRDSDPVATPSCGECVPGFSFVEDGACALGQFCDDAGACRNVTSSDLWRAACPFELGAHSSIGWCGAGLRCYVGRCVECIPDIDAIPGALSCTSDGRWTWADNSDGERSKQAAVDSTGASGDVVCAPVLVLWLVLVAVIVMGALGALFVCCCSPRCCNERANSSLVATAEPEQQRGQHHRQQAYATTVAETSDVMRVPAGPQHVHMPMAAGPTTPSSSPSRRAHHRLSQGDPFGGHSASPSARRRHLAVEQGDSVFQY